MPRATVVNVVPIATYSGAYRREHQESSATIMSSLENTRKCLVKHSKIPEVRMVGALDAGELGCFVSQGLIAGLTGIPSLSGLCDFRQETSSTLPSSALTRATMHFQCSHFQVQTTTTTRTHTIRKTMLLTNTEIYP
jgi:hypothetical protein